MGERSLRARIDGWIFDSHRLSSESLSLYRLVFCAFLLAVAMPSAVWVGTLPDALYDPAPGPLRLLSGFPSPIFFHGLGLALSLSVVALALGIRPKSSALVTGILLMTLIGFEQSFGKLDHNRVFLPIVPIVLAWGGWARSHTVERTTPVDRPDAPSWPTTLLAFLLGLFFLSSGLPKLFNGWLDPWRHAVGHQLGRSSLGEEIRVAVPGYLLELGDWFTVAFEVGFLFAVFAGLRWTRIFCAIAVIFHLGTLVLMRIEFTEQLIVYAAFVDWKGVPVMRRIAGSVDAAFARLGRAPIWSVAVLGTLYFWFHTALGSPFSTQDAPFILHLALGIASALVALGYLARRIRRFRRS